MDERSGSASPFGLFADSIRESLSSSSSIPLYHQLARVLRRYIEQAGLQPGERFPAEELIASEFGVSRPTANRSVQELINQGWLERERGRGTFIQDQKTVDLALLSEHLSLTEQFPPDATLRTDLIDRKILDNVPHVARTLALPDEAAVLFLRRLRFVDERPVMICDSYLPVDRFSDLDEDTFVRNSLYATLEEHYAFTVTRSERRVEAEEVVEQAISTLLEVPLFSPILLLTGLTFVEGEEEPIEFMTAYVRERVAFKSTVHRKAA